MGTGYSCKCDRCGYSVSTSGPWEFYRDSKGNRKPYGHPVPTSEEARERGIYGFSGELYCPKCDRKFEDLILVEFVGSSPDYSLDYLSAWAAWGKAEDMFKGGVTCPECHVTNLIWDTTEAEEAVCPRCKEGILVGEAIWIA
jgi:uncharacterized protein YbaR (Trm112 family)